MKLILKITLLMVLILAVALFAAPFFVRQEQVKNFIQERVKLPENAKLQLEGDIDFSVFPYANVKIPKAKIINADGSIKSYEKVSLGFDVMNLIGDAIDFDFSIKMNGLYYSGNLNIIDYKGFKNNNASPIVLKLHKPIKLNAIGNFARIGDEYQFNNFLITHKQTQAKGNLKANKSPDKGMEVYIKTEITSDNIEDIRKLTQIGKDKNNNNNSFNQLSGNGTANLELASFGFSSGDYKRNLNGNGAVNIDDASIYGIDLNEIIGAPQETKIEQTNSKKIDINDVDIRFNVENGVANVKEFSANNQLAYLSGQGVVDIVQKALKFSVDIDAEVASARVKIPLLVSGQFDNIKFEPRAGDALISNVDKIIGDNKIQLKNIKINLDKNNIGKSIEGLKNLGKSFGIDLDKATGGVLNKIAPAPEAVAPAARSPSPTEVAPVKIEAEKPNNINVPASMQINVQPATQAPAN